ncbi:MAG: MFS transporter [Opitutaceae bacterium]
MQLSAQNRRYMMAVVMLLMFMPPGMWVTALPNILEAHEAIWILPYATALAPFFAIFSGLVFGSLSDRKINAERLLAGLGFTGAFALWMGFATLKWGWHPGWYLFFQGINALISGPMFALMSKVKLVNLPNAAKSYPIYAMFGTIGWICGGLLVSALGLDASAETGQIAAFIRIAMSVLCLLMPATPPNDFESKGWKAALGLNAFKLLKDRELRVFYIASALFAAPCMAFFMFAPMMLKAFGSGYPSAQMTIGQGVEIFAMLFLSFVAGRFRVRWFLIVGFSLGILRFGLFALAGEFTMIALIWLGIALHGPIYAFTMVAGRLFLDKRVPQTMRGQAQALYQLLCMSVAGILGAFACGWLFEWLVTNSNPGWNVFWWILTGSISIPLIYFVIGIIGKPRKNK